MTVQRTKNQQTQNVQEILTLQRAILDSANYSIISFDLQGVVRTFNAAAERMLGYQAADVIDIATFDQFHDPEELALHAQENCARRKMPVRIGLDIFLGSIRAGIPHEQEWTYVRRNQTRFPVLLSVTALRNEGGEITGFLGIGSDITERKQFEQDAADQMIQIQDYNMVLEFQKCELEKANAQLEALATLDGLTSLKNHRAFQEMLSADFQRAARYGKSLSLLLLDVDKFKQYNDTYGHPAGDEVLRTVARQLSHNARQTDFVARYGGEEFVVILTETDRAGAMIAAERFRSAIEQMHWEKRPITASFGVATFERGMPNSAALVSAADAALYAAKAAGRNCIRFAEESAVLV